MIMLEKKNGNNILIIALGLIFFALSVYIHSQNEAPQIVVSRQDTAVNFNHNFIKVLSLGNKRLVSSILWIQTLLQADLEHYNKRDLNNWLYLRFLSISTLDELFYENYLWGGMYLSIVKDDVIGAADIFEKGLKYYPNDYKLNYNAGFNYYFEMGDFKKGLEKLEVIANDPKSPKMLIFIINKLRYETTFNFEAAFEFLRQRFETTTDPVLKKKLFSDLYALKAQRDLDCLNSLKKDCAMIDIENNRYIYQNGKWVSQKKFVPYKIHLRKKERGQ